VPSGSGKYCSVRSTLACTAASTQQQLHQLFGCVAYKRKTWYGLHAKA
jgi:hypothetical protein